MPDTDKEVSEPSHSFSAQSSRKGEVSTEFRTQTPEQRDSRQDDLLRRLVIDEKKNHDL